MSSNCPAALVHGSIDILATIAATGVNNVSRGPSKLPSLQVAYVHVTSCFFVSLGVKVQNGVWDSSHSPQRDLESLSIFSSS